MNLKHLFRVTLATLTLLLAVPSAAFSRAKIPIGTCDVIEIVYHTPKKDSIEVDGKHLDIARLHKEFNIAYILPLFIEEDPRLVLYDAKNKTYYETTSPKTKAFLDAYLKEKNLKEEDLLRLGLYTRYGGKVVMLLFAAFLIWGIIPSKKKEPIEPKKL